MEMIWYLCYFQNDTALCYQFVKRIDVYASCSILWNSSNLQEHFKALLLGNMEGVARLLSGGWGAAALPTLEKFAKISNDRAENRPKVGQNLRKQWIFYRAAPLNLISPYAYGYDMEWKATSSRLKMLNRQGNGRFRNRENTQR